MQEKSIIKQNILKYLDFKGISPYKFYQESGITRGILSQNNGMSEENTAKFLAYCNEVNIEWLITGKGEMLIDTPDDIFVNRTSFKSEEERKRELFNSFGFINSGDDNLMKMVANLERFNDMLTKAGLLQDKVIEGLEFKIQTLQKELSDLKYKEKDSFLHRNVAEPTPELIKQKK